MKLSVNDWEHVQNECFTDEEGSTTFRDNDHEFLCTTIERRTNGKRRGAIVAIGMDRHFSDLTVDALKRSQARFEQDATP